MAVRIAAILVILTATVLLLTYKPKEPASTEATLDVSGPERTPQFAWSQVSSKDFALGPGESMGWELQSSRAKLRFELDSSHPVAFRAGLHTIKSRADFSGPCAAWQVYRDTVECQQETTSPFPFVVADTRDELTMLKGLAAVYLQSASTFEEASRTNRVKLTIHEWRCLANCDLLPTPPPTSPRRKSAPR